MKEKKRFIVLACEVLYRELCHVAARSPHIVDLRFVTQGLHDIGKERMSKRLQEEIDSIENHPDMHWDAILMGYGLCSNGIVGLSVQRIPLVIPRVHDCIALFFGSHDLYHSYFQQHPGTYFYTSGWLERDHVNLESAQQTMDLPGTLPGTESWDELVKKFGEENATYVWNTMYGLPNYTHLLYLDMGVHDPSSDIEKTKQIAQEKGLIHDIKKGNLDLVNQLVSGDWNETDFLVCRPGERVIATFDGTMIDSEIQ